MDANKPFYVQQEPNRPRRLYADFFSAERYAIRWLHRLGGQEITINCIDDSIVAYCRLSPQRTGLTFVTLEWSARINLQLKPLDKANKRKTYKFIDHHRQISLFP